MKNNGSSGREFNPYQRWCFWLMLIFSMGFVLRLASILGIYFAGYQYPDESAYWEVGQRLLAGHGISMKEGAFEGYVGPGEPTAYWGFLFPALVAGCQAAFGPHLLAVRLFLGLSFYTATAVGLFWFTRRWLSQGEMLAVAVLLAIYPNFHFLGCFVMTENLYVPLVLFIFVLHQRGILEGGRLRIGVLGVLYGMAHLVRPTLIPFQGALLALHCLLPPRNLQKLINAILCLVISALVLSPWVARNYVQYHQIAIETKSGLNLWNKNNYNFEMESLPKGPINQVAMPEMRGLNEAQRSALCNSLFIRFAFDHPKAYLGYCVRRLEALWSLTPVFTQAPGIVRPWLGAFNLLLYGFMIVGMVRAWRQGRFLEPMLLLIYITILSTMTISSFRFRAYGDPFVLVFAGMGLVSTLNVWLKRYGNSDRAMPQG